MVAGGRSSLFPERPPGCPHSSHSNEGHSVWSPGFSRSDEVWSWISKYFEPSSKGSSLPAKAGTPYTAASFSDFACIFAGLVATCGGMRISDMPAMTDAQPAKAGTPYH
jgi:hypothetical protein